MMSRRFLWAFLPVVLLACDGENSTVQPPVPMTMDEQVVAQCHALRDAVESYAVSHDGNYPLRVTDVEIDLRNPYTGGDQYIEPEARFPGTIGYDVYGECDPFRLSGYRITGYGRDHQLITLENLANVSTHARWIHDVVVANARIVMSAAEAYKQANGRYAEGLSDIGVEGKVLIEYLPNGSLLFNPVFGFLGVPVDGSATEGESNYMSMYGVEVGYAISIADCYLNFADREFYSHSQEDLQTRSYATLLRDAVDQFAVQSGEYPAHVDAEETPSGKTVLELLPYAWSDPYTNQPSTPVNGVPSLRGQVGYDRIIQGGGVVGYVITGLGLFGEEIVRLERIPPS